MHFLAIKIRKIITGNRFHIFFFQNIFVAMKIEDQILIMLKEGLTQGQIADKLKEQGIKTNSLSSVEKKLKELRAVYEAKTLFHLACILHSQGYFEEIVGK